MKILFFGTHLKHYQLAKALRSRGYDCKVLLERHLQRNLPEAEDRNLEFDYPIWILDYRNKYWDNLLIILIKLRKKNFLLLYRILEAVYQTRKIQFDNVLKEADIIFTSGSESFCFLQSYAHKVIWRSLGGDLTQVPFRDSTNTERYFAKKLIHFLKTIKTLIYYQKDQLNAIDQLDLEIKSCLYSLPYEVSNVSELYKSDDYDEYENIFFLPSRKNLDPKNPNYKGSEKVIEALARTSFPSNSLVLVSNHGVNFEKFYDLLQNTLMDVTIEIIAPIPVDELLALFTLQNICVINDVGFEKHHLTGIGRECAAAGCFTIDSFEITCDPKLQLYTERPPNVHYSVSIDEIAMNIQKFIDMPKVKRKHMRLTARTWAKKYLSYENIVPLINLLELSNENNR